ncbi:MAG: hypothetical protein JRH20_26155 [Deltaproteobacteria bacterium]|nr:hypothetical protein [Deltaproteobacteria bacterium]
MSSNLPPCGLYKTTEAIGPVPAERLVYFHNHGNPGPGIYAPESWNTNRAVFAERGTVIEDLSLIDTLEPLPVEGLYYVKEEISCCVKGCRTFAPGVLVQLGYNGAAQPLLFVPHWHREGLHIPEQGFALDKDRICKLERLTVDQPKQEPSVSSMKLN